MDLTQQGGFGIIFDVQKKPVTLSLTHTHTGTNHLCQRNCVPPLHCFNFNGVRNTITSSSNEIHSVTVRRNERRQRDGGGGWEGGAEMRAGVRAIRDISGSHKMMIQKQSGEEQSSNGLSFQITPQSYLPCTLSSGLL